MARAICLARRAWGQTHPNPMVGAVLVEGGEIVAEGWHRAAGQRHAEIEALQSLGRRPQSEATLYVTLEPCSTQGQTGACTAAIIESGIRRVIVGALDPNPAHSGRGLRVLSNAGVEVIQGVLADECSDLNLIFNHWIVNQRPLVAAKIATTLDGKFGASNGQSKWVTGEKARANVMEWRRYFPAIAVSAPTALADDPSLTSRIEGDSWCPRRFLFDRELEIVKSGRSLQLLADRYRERTTIVCSDSVDTGLVGRVDVEVWRVPEVDGHLDFDAFAERCAIENIYGIYLEPGPRWATSLIESETLDYLFHYVAPKYICDSTSTGLGSSRGTQSMDSAIQLIDVRQASFGEDCLIRGFLK